MSEKSINPPARPRLYVATPSHDHKFHAGYALSLIRLISSGLYPVQISKVGGAGVARARNNMAQEFLASNCDYYFAIDADLTFTPENVARIVSAARPLVCGAYALKSAELQWCVNPLPNENPDSHGYQKVASSGTGFMCIHRSVFEAMIAAHPEIAYTEDLQDAKGITRWDFFSMGVVNRRYLTEDWYFCHRARALGYAVWLDCTFHVPHEGFASYPLTPPPTDPAPLWPAEFIAAGLAPDHCADVLAGCYDVPVEFDQPPVILDLGANVGAFARWASARWPGSILHCYEPDPANFALLKKTVATLTTATPPALYKTAVSDEQGWRPLYRGQHNCGEHSLHQLGEQQAASCAVSVMSAADLPLADLIKLDTEGSEWPILRTLSEEGALCEVRAIVLEYHSEGDRERITALLQAEGFTLHAYKLRHTDRGELKFIRA
jgi:FkbM family methyltransferase